MSVATSGIFVRVDKTVPDIATLIRATATHASDRTKFCLQGLTDRGRSRYLCLSRRGIDVSILLPMAS